MSVDLLNKFTILYAMRLFKFVLMNSRARKNVSVINYGILFENVENVVENGNNLVVMFMLSLIIVIVSSGSGFVMISTIVVTKIASKFYVCVVILVGVGMRYRINLDKIEYLSGLSFVFF